VDLTFTDLRQLANVPAGLCDIIRRHGLCRITGEFVEAVEYRAQLPRVRRGYDGLAPEAARERGRLFLAGIGSGTVLSATSALFDAERDLRLRVGVASGS
jgi:hypothetical protein